MSLTVSGHVSFTGRRIRNRPSLSLKADCRPWVVGRAHVIERRQIGEQFVVVDEERQTGDYGTGRCVGGSRIT